MRKSLIYFALAFALPMAGLCQSQKLELHKGNEAYNESRYEEALNSYGGALEKDGEMEEARFNRANAMLRLSAKMAEDASKLPPEEQQAAMENVVSLNKKAASDFESIARNAENDEARNKALYNQGNAHILSGEIDKGIDAYKQALRVNPDDDEARYNLAYAMKMKQEQEKQEQNQEQDQEQEQQDEQDEEQQEQQQQDQKDQNNQQEKQPDKPQQLTKEEAEQLLEAMMQREKELQEELNKSKQKPQTINIEKDW